LFQSDKYRLNVADGVSDGMPLTTGMIGHSGWMFTTIDQDNDADTNANCAKTYRGGWW